ncbi:MAG: T9SS type A sorting domain-containing protein [Sphingobacteriales bacterium]
MLLTHLQAIIAKTYDAEYLKKGFLSLLVLLIFQNSKAQTTVSSILNVTGSSSSTGSINFDWNVGESVMITTASNNSVVLTQGLLQGFGAIKPIIGDVVAFQRSEIKVYPNPVVTFFNLDVFTTLRGIMEWTILDSKGALIKTGKFNYYGEGYTTTVDMTGISSGTYFIKLSIFNFGNGFTKPLREVSFKIVKVNQ